MSKKLLLWLIWGLFVFYAFAFAPPNQPDTIELIKNLSTGNFAGINPLVIALFNIMGVLPLLYACFLYSDGRMQRIPAWAFSLVSFGVGAFAILPYLALRQPNPLFAGEKNAWLKLWDSRITGGLIAIGAIVLLSYGITQGNWSDFVQQWQTSRFIHVMSLDFCLLCLLFPFLLADDMTRRGLTDRRIFWAVTLVPLLGTLAYVVLRPPLNAEVATTGEAIMQS